MKFLTLFMCLFSLYAAASDIKYTDATFKASPLEHAQKLDMFFKDEGYIPLADPTHGIPSLGINQVYMKDAGQFIMIKYGIKGDFPLNEWINAGEGQVIHQQTGDNKYFLYFRGIGSTSARLVVERMKDKVSSYKIPAFNLFVPKAHADDCATVGSATINQMQDFTALSAHMVWDFAKNCATGLGQGAWSQTGGAVADGISSLWNVVTHPIDTIVNVGSAVYNFTIGLGQFIKGLVTNPRATMARAGANIGGAWNQMTDVVANMSNDLKIQFVCNLLGALGVDAAIAFFTAGAGSARVALMLGTMARKFTLISRVWGILSRMNATARGALGLTGERMKAIMAKLMNGTAHEDDLRHIEDVASVDHYQALGALACAI